MIDINKFKDLANKIVEESTKSEMETWFENYKTERVSFINFKSIEVKFKMDFTDINFQNEDAGIPYVRFSIAA